MNRQTVNVKLEVLGNERKKGFGGLEPGPTESNRLGLTTKKSQLTRVLSQPID